MRSRFTWQSSFLSSVLNVLLYRYIYTVLLHSDLIHPSTIHLPDSVYTDIYSTLIYSSFSPSCSYKLVVLYSMSQHLMLRSKKPSMTDVQSAYRQAVSFSFSTKNEGQTNIKQPVFFFQCMQLISSRSKKNFCCCVWFGVFSLISFLLCFVVMLINNKIWAAYEMTCSCFLYLQPVPFSLFYSLPSSKEYFYL